MPYILVNVLVKTLISSPCLVILDIKFSDVLSNVSYLHTVWAVWICLLQMQNKTFKGFVTSKMWHSDYWKWEIISLIIKLNIKFSSTIFIPKSTSDPSEKSIFYFLSSGTGGWYISLQLLLNSPPSLIIIFRLDSISKSPSTSYVWFP